jgi:Flp pilus assembly protein TadB
VSLGALWCSVSCAALAAALVVPTRPRLGPPAPVRLQATQPAGWLHRHRALWALLAGCAGWVLLGGGAGPVGGVVVGVGTWVVIGRAEPSAVRRAREDVRRDLPYVVGLLGATLRAGAAPADGVAVVADALPGAAADRLAGVTARLALGLDPVQVWSALADDAQLGRLGRAMARSHASGAPVLGAVERLADELAGDARAETEQRARAVGVKAALPLGLCLLPAFLLVGIVPLVVGLLDGLRLG